MHDQDYDEDLYEEKSKLVYKRRSSTSHHDLFREPSSSRTDSDDRSPEQPFRGRGYSETPRSSHKFSAGRRASWSEMSRRTDPIRDEMVERSPSYDRLDFSADEPMDGTVEIRKVKKRWSYKTMHGRRDDESSYGRSVDQSSYGGREGQSTKASTVRTEDMSKIPPAERHVYCPVAKWDVDYTNRNYVRSKCNKNIGLHRYTLGRQFKWDVDYDNTHYLRSQVNAPKGLHRKKKDIKRKRVPDNDILADSTGWEFEYGPEFLQVEEDVPYMPDERVVGRGAYRCYGVTRSYSDTDVKDEEKRQKIPSLIEDEFKYGTEFLQDDVQHTLDQKDGTIGRGAYRFYEADRSTCDKKPCDMMGIDYRESRARIDQSGGSEEEDKEGDHKGKPFKRTVLKKTVKLMPRPSDQKLFGDKRYKYGTHLKFVPGMGNRTVYEGTPAKEVDREPDMQITKHPSIRSVFTKASKPCKYTKCGESEEKFRCGKKYSHKHIWDECQNGKNNGEYPVSKALHPKKTEESFGTSDRCNLCDNKETAGKIPKTQERSYGREMPKKATRPPAQSYTSYESCNLCDRKEMPGMQKKALDTDDDSCIICEKKKAQRKGKKRSSPSSFMRGLAYSSKGHTEKHKKAKEPERSYDSFDSCELCEKHEAPRVSTPKRRVELKSIKRSPAREAYAKKTSPSYHSCDRYGEEEIYEERRKTSLREHRAPKGEFRKWKEMEQKETCPLRMTGSISQRNPRKIREEPKTREWHQRFNSPYACPVEMMGYPKRLADSSSQKRAIKVPKEPRQKECLGRYQDQCVYSGEVINDDQDMSSEEFVPHVESSIRIVKKTVSRTSFPAQKNKISPKRNYGSVSRKLPADVRKESKHKDCFENHHDKDNYLRGIKEKGKIVDMFPSHSGSRIRTVAKKTSPTRFPDLKEKENGKIVEKFPSNSGSRIRTLAKKASPTKLPDVKRKSLKEYREDDVDEFSDSDEIDFEEHKNHPRDHAKSYKDGYEKVSSLFCFYKKIS
ncbi:unnamed protein product [Larinioides sclopetarius]|uniref:Uncharacterized protein n=1 Tax=Larinioides sclopetarius TaxID=280406 RepID=A0AAV1ZT07_9ARAC